MATPKLSKTSISKVGIVGAGPVGCLLALGLQRRGYQVTLFDFRPDPNETSTKPSRLRSINLALSSRGIRAIELVSTSLAKQIMEEAIPMHGRMIHDATGQKQESQPYGLYGESINSIDRFYINQAILDKVRGTGVELCFNHKLVKVEELDTIKPTLTFEVLNHARESTRTFDFFVGSDGAHSNFRHQMQRTMRMDFLQKYVDMQYMELHIPPKSASNGPERFQYDSNHLHIWPRHNFMLIALPNQDGSFSVTFFSPWAVVESLDNAEKFVDFFRREFPDAFPLLGEKHLLDAYENHPRGPLMQVGLYPYHHPSGRAIIIGDAAHSMVPFYGQGMNCGLEDVRVLLELLGECGGNVPDAFSKYSQTRKRDLDAICQLALDNYYEMSSRVTSVWFLARKKLDAMLSKYCNGRFMTWLPLYTMVSFRDDIPYASAIDIERRQAKILSLVQYSITGMVAVGIAFKAYQKVFK